jgi:hypothetical protein
MKMRTVFPYLARDRDRHGNERLHVRRGGRKIRVREGPQTEAFARIYAEALLTLENEAPPAQNIWKGSPAGTLGWLAACYIASVEFRQLDRKSQATRRGIIEACLQEPRLYDIVL